MFLLGGGEEAIEESVTVTMVYIEPSVGQPTQDSTKDFTPRMDTDPVREKSGKSIPRKPFTTKVRCHLCLCHRTFIAPDKSLDNDVAVGLKVGGDWQLWYRWKGGPYTNQRLSGSLPSSNDPCFEVSLGN